MNYVSLLGFVLAVLSLLGLGTSGLGYRWGFWSYKTGISIVKCSGFISFVAAVVCLIGVWHSRWKVFPEGMAPALVGLMIAASVLALTLTWKRKLDSHPYIHDITTDTENPPAFDAILPLRANSENPSVYGGSELARQQLIAYPDLKPIVLSEPPQAAFTRAVQVAQDMGWKIVNSNPQSLRIEATDTTLWFGFHDDVVVRITPAPAGSRIDVRSTSDRSPASERAILVQTLAGSKLTCHGWFRRTDHFSKEARIL